MSDLSNIQYISLLGFFLAIIFGFVAAKTNFCTMGAVSDLVNIGSKGRLGAWFFAAGVAILGAQYLSLQDMVALDDTMYLSTNFALFGYILGGFLFGIGMTLGAGCGQRNLVRVGGGNLKSVVVVIIMGITAYMTMRGLLAIVRIDVIEQGNINLADMGMETQSLAHLVSAIFGLEHGHTLQLVMALLVGLGLVLYAIKQEEFRTSFDNILAGVVIGSSVVAAWYITGVIGYDDFDPVAPQGLTFVGPTGNTISYLMTFTGAEINFGIAVTFGMILGSFAYAISTGNFRIETFNSKSEMQAQMIGAVLMGFGGVISFGCTIGQGVSGMSTLAMGSFITLGMIFFGSALTMKVQYQMMDEEPFMKAVTTSAAEMLNPFKKAE
jgi:uncharacterized membrane protein YedE/YeeE